MRGFRRYAAQRRKHLFQSTFSSVQADQSTGTPSTILYQRDTQPSGPWYYVATIQTHIDMETWINSDMFRDRRLTSSPTSSTLLPALVLLYRAFFFSIIPVCTTARKDAAHMPPKKQIHGDWDEGKTAPLAGLGSAGSESVSLATITLI